MKSQHVRVQAQIGVPVSEARKAPPVVLRPRERVLEYLVAEFDRPDLKMGCRLPTNRELAARLKVSVPTIQAVMRRLSQEGRIQTRNGGGTFLVSRLSRPRDVFRIAVGVPLPADAATNAWVCAIGSGMFRAALQCDPPVMLMGQRRQGVSERVSQEALLEQRSGADGLVLFPYTPYPLAARDAVRAAYEKEGKPVVDMNPPNETVTANFVAPDYYGGSRLLGQAWKETGRRRIVLLAATPLSESVSARLRQAGLASGLGIALGDEVALRVFDGLDNRERFAAAIEQLFANPRNRPDAIYCSGDFLALKAFAAVRERGARVPEDVSVVGGSGVDLSETNCPQLTRTKQPLEKIGEELVRMITQRIERDGESLPGQVLHTPYTGGATTRPEENARLGIAPLSVMDAVSSRMLDIVY